MDGRWLSAVIGLLICCLVATAQGQSFSEPEFAAGEPFREGDSPFDESEEAEDEIETDRDSFTLATTTAGCGRIIFEGAHSFIDNRTVPETHSFPELLVRYGASDWLELRLGWNYEVGGAGSPVSGNVPSDIETTWFGLDPGRNPPRTRAS